MALTKDAWQTLAKISPVGMFHTDAAGAIDYVNPQWCAISGLRASEAWGDGWLDAVHPADRDTLGQLWLESPRHRTISSADYRFVRADGSIAWVMGQVVPEVDGQKRLVGYVGTITDITQRKQAEERLRRLSRIHALLSDVNQTIVRERDQQALFKAVCRIAVDTGEFCMAWIGLLDPQTRHIRPVARAGDTDGYLDALCIALDDSERGGGPTATALRAGQRVVVNDIESDPRMAPWRDHALRLGYRASAALPLMIAGAVHGTLNLYAPEPGFFDEDELKLLDETAADIAFALEFTEEEERRHRAEEALLASEQQRALIYANITDIVFYLAVEPDDRFRFVSVNPAFLKATGLAEDAVVGRPVEEVIPEPALTLVLGHYGEAVRTEKAVAWEETTIYPAGTRYGEVSVTPILDAGVCTHLIGTVHDVTGRVQAEVELRRLNAELEERVARRTEELQAAMRRAQESDQLKSAFLATMSHELRTPLNSILGFSGVLLQGLAGPLNPEQAKQLGMARDSAHHLLALINDVLDISKIEAMQLEVAREPFEMRGAIEDTVRAVAPQAQKKGLALTVGIGVGVGVVVGDRRRVEQILLNLLSNAIKFTEHGEVRLACRVHEGRLETSVSDTGMGIRQEDLGRLFEPFVQLETGLNRSHEGTGLGLAICKNLVRLLGGQIHAQSEWGGGSTFVVTLPLSPEGGPLGEHPDH
jgi:PAS domain S-box-containing protein